MPRIPTRDSLRQGVPRSTGAIIKAPRDFVGPAIQNAGNQLFDVAKSQKDRERQQEKVKRQQAALELASARSQWASSLLAERTTYAPEHNPDHDNWVRTYQSRAGGLQKQAAGVISDPEIRRRFVAEMQDDLDQVGASIDRQAREAGMIARRTRAEEALSQQVELAASQPDEEAKSVMGGVRASLQDMVDTGIISTEEAAGRSVGYAQQYASLKTLQLTRQDPSLAVSVLKDEQSDPAMLIRQLYRFRATPYWEDGANRAGYGSDTITREDGTVARIPPGVAIDRADAERDLQRRVEEVRSGVVGQVGGKVFGRLAPHVQTALVSVGYSAGLLPDNVVTAVQSGDVEAIATAIATGVDEHSGVPEQIRLEQAAIVRDENGKSSERLTQRPWWVDVLEPEQRAGLFETASREVERADAKQALSDRTRAWQLAQSARSDIRAAYSTGQATDIDPEDMLRELGPEKHRKWLETRQDAADIVANTQDMPSLPGAQITDLVEAYRPQTGGENVASEQRTHDRISRRANEIMGERRDKPARAALRIPAVRRALSEAQNPLTTSPQKVQALVREMTATQSALGVARTSIAPVPEEWAMEIGSALLGKSSVRDSEMTDEVRKTYAGIKQQFGEFTDDVIAYSVSRSAALLRETSGRIGELLNSAAVNRPIRQQQAGGPDTA
ncbi:MAG: hypothetical protein ACR2OL_17215 [Anderseniella sp.]